MIQNRSWDKGAGRSDQKYCRNQSGPNLSAEKKVMSGKIGGHVNVSWFEEH